MSTTVKNTIEVRSAALTAHGELACPGPMSAMQTWNGHPRVFLSLAATGEAQCPYCGTVYRIKAGDALPRAH